MKNTLLYALALTCICFFVRAQSTYTIQPALQVSITHSQDNRDPKEINSSAESRKRRRQDELQR